MNQLSILARLIEPGGFAAVSALLLVACAGLGWAYQRERQDNRQANQALLELAQSLVESNVKNEATNREQTKVLEGLRKDTRDLQQLTNLIRELVLQLIKR